MSVHFTNRIKDSEGTGNELIQYSYISLKEDAINWLRKNGRLPSTHIDDYFQEIEKMNQVEAKIKALETEK